MTRLLVLLAAFAIGAGPSAAAALSAPAAQTPMSPITTGAPAASTDYNLPELGIAGGAAFPPWKSAVIGRLMYYELQRDDAVLNDPLVAGYINYLGHRLSSVTGDTTDTFHYFPLDDPAINAFAAPGGFVAVFTGLIEVTRNEDELAGVMAHETAHEIQHHINREVADSRYNSLIDLAMLIGALAVGVANPDLAAGALMGAEGGAMQREINYSRADEYEADRVGISILAKARFNPDGMINFFEYMQQQYAMNGYQIPQFLSNHPLPLTRISEAENRAKSLHVVPAPEDPNYALMKARIRVLTSDDLDETLDYFRGEATSELKPWYREAAVYGMVLCLTHLGQGKRALELIKPLATAHADNIALQLALAEAMIAAGEQRAGLDALAQDNTLYPSNMAVAMSYARALLDARRPKAAVAALSPVAPLIAPNDPIYIPDARPCSTGPGHTSVEQNEYGDQGGAHAAEPNERRSSCKQAGRGPSFGPPPASARPILNPDVYQLLATAANQSGNQALTYLAMANYFAGRAQFGAAIVQLRLGLRLPNLSPLERQQMISRSAQLRAELKQAKQLGATG